MFFGVQQTFEVQVALRSFYAASCAGENPEQLIEERAHDSDPLDEAIKSEA